MPVEIIDAAAGGLLAFLPDPPTPPGWGAVLFTSVLIIIARIADVSMGTVRTVAVVHGRRGFAWILGFLEVLIWILVVARVIQTIGDSPLYPIAYALGFAMGNYLGITIENQLAHGEQVVRIFSRRGAAVAAVLREQGFRVTEFDGRGRDGPVEMLFIETRRKLVPRAVRASRDIDPQCFYVVDDVRLASEHLEQQSGGWRSVLKRK